MTYKILSTRQQEQILYTLVEYNFDSYLVEVDVAHFNPQTTEDIEQNIINRSYSELQKIESINLINNLIQNIDLNLEKNIN